MKTLIVVDMQNDFIDGSLGTREAQAIRQIILTHRRERSFRWSIASKEQRAGRLQKV